MDLHELWDRICESAAAMSDWFGRSLARLLGTSNERELRRLQPIVDRINAVGPKLRELSDEQLRSLTEDFKRRLHRGETLDDLLPEAYAAVREAAHRALGKGKWVDDPFTGKKIPFMAHFDVQLLGGIVLHQGKIAEMVTGEGKTLVATLPAYLNALTGEGVHIVTVNDYLARRDAEWMGPVYRLLGLPVGYIQAHMEETMGPESRMQAYGCDITYGTNNEFGFDYLRDNMKPARRGDSRYPVWLQQVQRGLNYAIIDEVDNILIDEARTPLIISGPAFDDVARYYRADEIARQLKPGLHFEVKEKERQIILTDEGIRCAEKLAGVESFYTPGHMEWPHLIDNALKAHYLYKRDRDYVVLDGQVVIVDEFTGRLMKGRQWSDGLHQAVEAKERVRIKEETQTLATITIQNFFKLYRKLAGMTGTAMTEANEFWKIYKLDVVAIPPNRPLRRIEYPDLIFRTAREKWKAVVREIEETHRTGRPILVGTTSIANSELLSEMLRQRGIPHQVLNAKYHEREAEIIAQAGRKGAVTIATNMAGRGTDIILGGNPEYMAWTELKAFYPSRLDVPPDVWKAKVEEVERRERMYEEGREVAALGGLHVIGTERHEARRIDNQLRGRAGRQGDPGSSRFFLSLEDDLLRLFGGERLKRLLTTLGMQEGEAIESRWVSRQIQSAQRKVEERNFDIRKHLLEYDEVMDEQRKRVYGFRQDILDDVRPKEAILEMFDEQIDAAVERFCNPRYGVESFVDWVSRRLGVELDARHFANLQFQEACDLARDAAIEQASSAIHDAVEENLPQDVDDPTEWNWEALASWANTRWGLRLRDRDLKTVPREEIESFLLEKARQAIEQVDLTPAAEFLQENWGLQSLAEWAQHKLAARVEPTQLAGKEPEELEAYLKQLVRQRYFELEVETPVSYALNVFLPERPNAANPTPDRQALVDWVKDRFGVQLDYEVIRTKFRSDLAPILRSITLEFHPGPEAEEELRRRLEELLGPQPPCFKRRAEVNRRRAASGPVDQALLASFATWFQDRFGISLPLDQLASLSPEEVRRHVWLAYDDKFRPELRETERVVLLEILDASWKDHLYAMDHLKSAIGLRGYAQVDPKAEYKREGMKLFHEMWAGVANKVTDSIFRVGLSAAVVTTQLYRTEDRRRQTVEIHEDATGSSIRAQQEAAMASSGDGDGRVEPIRISHKRVGRNDPCPCGSGRKYKNCCLRKANPRS
jgi:preprotein translocase subunit SecA